ncbi:hypothetical protein DRN73_07970 [Candidatus Pacearchaeota archaeon]|nr:MAG: hypothetical protein DRN73_07970 [Candidatus Pacearchaeota archaeon]
MNSSATFFITDILYKKNNTNKLILFGRKKNHEKIILEAEYNPYFWINTKEIDFLAEKINKLDGVVKVSSEKKEIDGKGEKLLKIEFSSPEALVEIKRKIREWPEIIEIREHDIPFEIRYLIDNKLKQFFLCKAELEKNKIISITRKKERIMPRILAYDIETEFEKRFPNAKKDRIIAISYYGSGNFKKVALWKRYKTQKKYVKFVNSEKELLKDFEATIKQFDPDIIVGYNSDNFDMPFIKERLKQNKVEINLNWISDKTKKIAGISELDAYISIRKILGQNLRTNRYDLDSVSKELLGLKKLDKQIMLNITKLLKSSSDSEFEQFVEYNLNDSVLAFKLLEKIFPTLIELNSLTNSLIEESSKMSYGQLVEWFLINEHYNAGKIIPNKPSYREVIARERKRVKGAYVFKPNAGLYEDLHVLDFRSLYPSIVCAHKISPTKTDFIPNLIKKVLAQRKKIKKEMKQKYSEELNAQQFALKTIANSFYGYLRYGQSRWYSFESAEKITSKGRSYIKKVISEAKQEGFNIIYGDTDSVFLNGKPTNQVKKFVKKINESLPKEIELEYENHYKVGLFLSRKNESGGAKKRYALLDDENKVEIKGLEAIRGDWSELAKKVQTRVIEKILTEKKPDSALEYVRKIIKDIEKRNVKIEELVIRTRLLKALNQYKSRGPHISAAQKYVKLGYKINRGSMVDYIVCKGSGNISNRIKLGFEASLEDYDPEYYINQQVIRVVFKIFELFNIPLKEITKSQTSLEKWN